MKVSLRLTIVAALLCLSVLGISCSPLPTLNSAYPGPETEEPISTPISATTPLPIIQPPPYPALPEPEPTATLPPEQPPTATPIPTVTPLPTALPLPPSAFHVMWVENIPTEFGEMYAAIVWRADPRDIAGRQEVVRFEDRKIQQAVLSPNGRQIALITTKQVQGGGPVWVVNLDGAGLQQLAPDAQHILWSQDNHAIFYYRSESDQVSVEQVDVASGESRQVLMTDYPFYPLGWSAGGRWLYYVRSNPNAYEQCELWKVDRDGGNPQFICSLGRWDTIDLAQVLLSPNGGKLLLGSYGDLRWISTDGQGEGRIILPYPEQGYSISWGHGENEVIVGQSDASYSDYHLYSLDIPSQQAHELTEFSGSGWGPLAISADRHWLMTSRYLNGSYWIHLSTGTLIPIPCQDCGIHFIAWIPSGTGH